MIRAALDCRTAFPALVIADCVDGELPRLLFAGSIMVGANVKRTAEHAPGLELVRVVSDYQIDMAVELLLEKLAVWDPKTLFLDEAPASRPYMMRIAAEVQEAAQCATNACKFPRAGKNSKSVPQCFESWPTTVLDHIDGWRVGDSKGTREAAIMLLDEVPTVRMPAREAPALLPPPTTPVATAGAFVLPPEEIVYRYSTDNGRTYSETRRPRILAIDTGAHIGICVAEELGGGRFARVLSRTVTLDPTDAEQRADFVEGLARLIHAERVERVVIERVDGVHGGDRGTGPGALAAVCAMATHLVQAAWLGGMAECLALARPGGALRVDTASAANWRRQIIGGRGTPADGAVATKVREAFPEWPDRTTEHERDAAGLVVWACRDLTPKTRKRAPGKPSGRKAGCTCPPRHKGAHLGTCPLRKARAAGTVQICKRCGAPRKGHACPAKSTSLAK